MCGVGREEELLHPDSGRIDGDLNTRIWRPDLGPPNSLSPRACGSLPSWRGVLGLCVRSAEFSRPSNLHWACRHSRKIPPHPAPCGVNTARDWGPWPSCPPLPFTVQAPRERHPEVLILFFMSHRPKFPGGILHSCWKGSLEHGLWAAYASKETWQLSRIWKRFHPHLEGYFHWT